MANWRENATPVQMPKMPTLAQNPYVDDIGAVNIQQPKSSWRDSAVPVQQKTWRDSAIPVKSEAPQPVRDNGFLTDAKNFVKSTAYSVPIGLGDELRDGVASVVANIGAPESYTPTPAVQEYLKNNPEYAKQLDEKYGADYKKDGFYNQARQQTQQEQSNMRQDSPIASIAGDITGTVLTGVASAGTKIGGAIGNSIRSGNPLTRIAKGIGAGAVSGGAYGAAQAEGDRRLHGGIEGAVLGGIGGGASSAIGSAYTGVKNAISPRIEKPIAELAKRAQDFGIPLRLDQISPTRVRSTVQKVSQEIPFSGVDDFESAQRGAWNKAVATKTLGIDDLTPASMEKFLDKSSSEFKNALGNGKFNIGVDDLSGLKAIENDAVKNLTGDVANIVKGYINQVKDDIFYPTAKNTLSILDEFGNPIKKDVIAKTSIGAEKIASLRSDLVKSLPKVHSQAKPYISEIIDNIDEVISKQIPAKSKEALGVVRKQWRSYKTIEPLLEKSTDGTINPTELMQKVASSKYIKASKATTGQDDLIDLARIGKEFLPKKSGSDTAQKLTYAQSLKKNPLTTLISTLPSIPNRGIQIINQSQKRVSKAIEKSSQPLRVTVRPKMNPLLAGAASANLSNK